MIDEVDARDVVELGIWIVAYGDGGPIVEVDEASIAVVWGKIELVEKVRTQY